MEHPIKEKNQEQQKFLKSLPDEQREFHEQMFSISNAALWYHKEAGDQEPTQEDFEHWLEGLKEPMKTSMRNKGFEACKSIIAFTRHVMERRDVGMDAWMKEHLTDDEFKIWISQQEK